MRLSLSLFLCAHGIAHLVGFLVPWKIVKTEEMPYKTTLFMGKIDVGNTGIRVMGILWLLIALSYFYAGWITYQQTEFWITYTFIITIISLIFCILAIPDSHIGVYINSVLISIYFLNNHYHWLS